MGQKVRRSIKNKPSNRNKSKVNKGYFKKAKLERDRELETRFVEGPDDVDDDILTVPFLRTKRQSLQQDISSEVWDFYQKHPQGINTWVKVSSGKSIANKNGLGIELCVRAIRNIPPYTTICVYAGELYTGNEAPEGLYTLAFGSGNYVDAEPQQYDLGYLYCNGLGEEVSCPRNHGRYINTIFDVDKHLYNDDGSLMYKYNAQFSGSVCGCDAMFVRTMAEEVHAGDEILIKYAESR